MHKPRPMVAVDINSATYRRRVTAVPQIRHRRLSDMRDEDAVEPSQPGWRGILAARGQKTVIGPNHKPRVVETIGDSAEIQSKIMLLKN